MKLVRVHNPSRIAVAKRRKGTKMAKRRRKTTRRRRVSARAANPVRRRRRRRHSRRRNPIIVARSTRRRRHHTRRRRHSTRRRNPSALRLGQIAKDMIYGAGGAILTRTGAALVTGFVPGSLIAFPFADAVLEAVIAASAVRWGVSKFLGKPQGDIAMLGGLISAGLKAADRVLPNAQQSLIGSVRAPIQTAPQAAVPVQGGGLGDVYDVDMQAAGFGGFGALGDVYDVEDLVG